MTHTQWHIHSDTYTVTHTQWHIHSDTYTVTHTQFDTGEGPAAGSMRTPIVHKSCRWLLPTENQIKERDWEGGAEGKNEQFD